MQRTSYFSIIASALVKDIVLFTYEYAQHTLEYKVASSLVSRQNCYTKYEVGQFVYSA